MMLFINFLLVRPTRDGFLIDINDEHDTLSTSQLIRRVSHSSVPCRAIYGMTTWTRRDVIRFLAPFPVDADDGGHFLAFNEARSKALALVMN